MSEQEQPKWWCVTLNDSVRCITFGKHEDAKVIMAAETEAYLKENQGGFAGVSEKSIKRAMYSYFKVSPVIVKTREEFEVKKIEPGSPGMEYRLVMYYDGSFITERFINTFQAEHPQVLAKIKARMLEVFKLTGEAPQQDSPPPAKCEPLTSEWLAIHVIGINGTDYQLWGNSDRQDRDVYSMTIVGNHGPRKKDGGWYDLGALLKHKGLSETAVELMVAFVTKSEMPCNADIP